MSFSFVLKSTIRHYANKAEPNYNKAYNMQPKDALILNPQKPLYEEQDLKNDLKDNLLNLIYIGHL